MCLRIMTALTVMRTALYEDDIADSRPVHDGFIYDSCDFQLNFVSHHSLPFRRLGYSRKSYLPASEILFL